MSFFHLLQLIGNALIALLAGGCVVVFTINGLVEAVSTPAALVSIPLALLIPGVFLWSSIRGFRAAYSKWRNPNPGARMTDDARSAHLDRVVAQHMDSLKRKDAQQSSDDRKR
jgi:hypothetical protein